MGYFGAQTGKRPVEAPEGEPAVAAREGWNEASPFMLITPGPRRSASDERVANAGSSSIDSPSTGLLCPLCRGALAEEQGIYRCQGRCGAGWIEQSPGQLLDLAALPYGACSCCPRRRPLVQSERGAVCPASGLEYLFLPGGPQPLATAAPLGLCLCCAPPSPLGLVGATLICRMKPANHYRRDGERLALISGSEPAELLDAIDAALRRNNARVTLHGLFDID